MPACQYHRSWEIYILSSSAQLNPTSTQLVGWVSINFNSPTEGRLPLKIMFHRRLSPTKGYLPPKVVFHRRLSSTESYLPPKVVFHQRLSSIEGYLPPKVVFQLRCLPPKVVFHLRCLPPKFVFNLRSSSTEGCLPLKVVFHKNVVFHWKLSSIGPLMQLPANHLCLQRKRLCQFGPFQEK